ncbi:hypothetical protein TNCV_3266961 [Trichonephila clavipes]|nr:hypothetical protein TNCV_3266961 [Trichonephila clavipes]
MSGNTCLSKGYPQSEVILKLKIQNSEAQQSMRASELLHEQMSRFVVCLKRDLQCLRPEASLVLIYRPNAGRDERQSRPCAAR